MAIASAASGARGRTRQAILDAAAVVWSRRFTAPLADIAEQAQVSRSTLHRYFADRSDLVDALFEDSLTVLAGAGCDAALAQGPADDALRRYVRAGVGVGDRLVFLFEDASRFACDPRWEGGDAEDDALLALIRRGQADGAFTKDLDAAWIQQMYYALIYTAIEAVRAGSLAPHLAADVVILSLENGIRPR